MTAEDRLRDLLRSEASTINPAGDGLARIRERVARRRRARFWLMPSAAIATAAAAAAFVLLAPDDHQTQTLQPGGTPTPTSEPSSTSQPEPPAPGDWASAAFWPFASAAQAQQVADPPPAWMTDGLEVGKRLVRDVLSLSDVTVVQTCVSCEVLGLQVAGKDVGTLQLGHYTVHGARVFTVADVSGTDLQITSPTSGTTVSSPTRVTGRIQGVDENVRLTLIEQDGTVIAQGGAPAGSAVPWSATLTWSRSDWSAGAVLATTASAKDGSTNRVTLLPVTRGTSAPTATFAGLVDGHVSLFDATTGKLVRQLTYPPSRTSDNALARSGDSVAWVRSATDRECHNELDRLDSGKPSTVASSTSRMFGWPALSTDASRLAWVETPCGSPQPAPDEVVLTVNGTETRRYQAPAGTTVNLLDVADDGALLLATSNGNHDQDVVGLLPSTATSFKDLKALEPVPGCRLAPSAGFDGEMPVAFDACGSEIRLVRFTPSGTRDFEGPTINAEAPTRLSVRDGQYLVWLFGGDQDGSIATYVNGAFTTLIENAGQGCSSIGDQKGCVTSPDW